MNINRYNNRFTVCVALFAKYCCICYNKTTVRLLMTQDFYVPMNELIVDKETHWTFTDIGITYAEIAERGIVLWCEENIKGRWTMLGGNKFGFEDAGDAMVFKLQFGF